LMTAIIRALDLVQRAPGIGTKLLVRLAIPAGFEPATLCLEGRLHAAYASAKQATPLYMASLLLLVNTRSGLSICTTENP
jgi:hypothetical protein